jgi:YVTN family beta-propeller protein
MTMRPVIKKYALILLLVLCGCQTLQLSTTAVREDEGMVFFYFQPFSHDAERLQFSLSALAALKDDGTEIPVPLALNEFNSKEMKRQRLIATAQLPEGKYSGFLVSVKSATLAKEGGAVALSVPETPQKIGFTFSVEKRTAYIISLTLNYAQSVQGEANFNPTFLAAIPARPLVEVTGYVSNTGVDAVTVFDKIHLQATNAIAAGSSPWGIVLDQRLRRAYVVLTGDDAVEQYDLNTQTLLAKTMLMRGDEPHELALTPDGQLLLVVNTHSDTVSIVDTLIMSEVNRIPVGRNPRSLVLDRTGTKAFVFNSMSDNISVIDIPYRQVMATITTGPEPVRGQFNRAGNRLYVIHAAYPYLFAIDPTTFSVVQRQFIGMGMVSLKIDTRTDQIYIGKKNDNLVTVYDPLSFATVGTIQAGGTVAYMTIDGETNFLYLVIPERKVVMVVNLASKKQVSEIDVSENPVWITMMGER